VPAPDLDVVIVSHRCAAALAACLDSLDAHRAHLRLRVRVIDTASGDGTAAVAAARPWVQATALPENVGFARASNLGLRGVTAPAVLVLNPDTIVPPGALRACLDALGRHPEVGVLGPRVVDADGAFDPRCRRGFPTVPAALANMSGLDRRLGWPALGRYTLTWLPEDRPADVVAVSGAVMLLRTAALREAGGFDEGYFMYGEDIDLCLRVAARGWRVRYWPGATVVHAGGGSGEGGRRRPEAETAHYRSMHRLTRAHRTGPRGAAVAAGVTVAAETALALSRLRGALRGWRAGPGRPPPAHRTGPAPTGPPGPPAPAPGSGRTR
jgi:GT2 family glycosyltransferase